MRIRSRVFVGTGFAVVISVTAAAGTSFAVAQPSAERPAAVGPATAAATDPTALVRTAQSRPIRLEHGRVRSVVGQAAITAGGGLIIRIAGPNADGVDGEQVLAQVRRRIPEIVSDPSRAQLKVFLKRDRTGEVQVLGPKNATQPDAVAYTFAWKVGRDPSIRILHVGT